MSRRAASGHSARTIVPVVTAAVLALVALGALAYGLVSGGSGHGPISRVSGNYTLDSGKTGCTAANLAKDHKRAKLIPSSIPIPVAGTPMLDKTLVPAAQVRQIVGYSFTPLSAAQAQCYVDAVNAKLKRPVTVLGNGESDVDLSKSVPADAKLGTVTVSPTQHPLLIAYSPAHRTLYLVTGR